MALLKTSLLLLGVFVASGCQTSPAESDVPAHIVNPTDASRAALMEALAKAFGGTRVRLADDALTQTSLLTIEAGARRTLENLPTGGRVLSEPMQFRLVKNGRDCVLVDLRDQSRYKLENTSCAPQ